MSAPQIESFDFSCDLLECLLWQYDNAPALQSLMQSKQDWINAAHSQFWSDWVADVFDLRTANFFGLTVWAAILGLPLVVPSGGVVAQEKFGFTNANENFAHGNFGAANAATVLTVDQARVVLRLRYFQLVTSCAVPEVNAFLTGLFGFHVYVRTSGQMQITYTFAQALDPVVKSLLSQFDLLPRPSGMSVNIVTP